MVSAGTAEKRMYWLQQLQKARREASAGGASAVKHSSNVSQCHIIFGDQLRIIIFLSIEDGTFEDPRKGRQQWSTFELQ